MQDGRASCRAATGTKFVPAGSPFSGIGAIPPVSPDALTNREARPNPGFSYSPQETDMDTTTLLIILILVLIIFGGGWYGRGRWF